MNIIFQKLIKYLFHRLTEFSTWKGLILILAGTWGQRNPDTLNTIINQTFIIVGLLGSMLPDKISFLKDETQDNQLKDQIIAVVKEELAVKNEQESSNISIEEETDSFISSDDIDRLQPNPKNNMPSNNRTTPGTNAKRVFNQPAISRTNTTTTKSRTESEPFGFNDK